MCVTAIRMPLENHLVSTHTFAALNTQHCPFVVNSYKHFIKKYIDKSNVYGYTDCYLT